MKKHVIRLVHKIVSHMYLLHDSAHVFFISHARQLQMDRNIFGNVGYSGHGLRMGIQTGNFRTVEIFAEATCLELGFK